MKTKPMRLGKGLHRFAEDAKKHMEFPTQSALDKYLQEHPGQRRVQHSVKPDTDKDQTQESVNPEYAKAYQAVTEATNKYHAVRDAYRQKKASDDEYLAARKIYEQAADDFDKASLKKNAEPKKAEPKLRVPLVIGHDEDQELLKRTDLPAAGWVDKVWREGDKLVASATKVPVAVKELLARKAFRTVSSEIYKDFPQGEKSGDVGSVLRRVAILGGEIPQVKTLDEINALYQGEDGYDIPRLEIFQSGDYNGEHWTDEDLDEMVENFAAMTVEPDKHSEMVRKFDEGSASFSRFSMPITEAKNMPHDKVITDLLSEAGFDASTITESVPATFLAESARVVSGFMEEARKHADESKAEEDEEEEKEEAPAVEEEEEEKAEEFAEHDCPECQGTGMKDGAKCEHCNGTGKVEDTTEAFSESDIAAFTKAFNEVSRFAAKAKKGKGGKGKGFDMNSLKIRKDVDDPEALAGWLRWHGNSEFAETCNHAECPMKKKEMKMSEARKFSELSGKLAGLEKSIAMREASERRAGIDAEITALVASGKVLPAELDGGLKDALYAADTAIVCKFSEGGKQKPASQLDLILRSLKARPAIAKFAERMGDNTADGGNGASRMSAERKAELLGATHLGRKIMAESSKSN